MTFQDRVTIAVQTLGIVQALPRRLCSSGKGMYATKELCLMAAERYERRRWLREHRVRLHVYKCKECNWWHLTRKKCQN